MYQKQINAEIAAIEAVLATRLGRPVSVSYTFTRSNATIRAHVKDGTKYGQYYGLAGCQCRSIDSALVKAMKTAGTLRTIQDENADLGLSAKKGIKS